MSLNTLTNQIFVDITADQSSCCCILGDQSDSDDSVIGRKKKKAADEEDDGLSDLEPSGEKVEGK